MRTGGSAFIRVPGGVLCVLYVISIIGKLKA